LNDGKGNITINKRELKEYFPNPQLQYIVEQPLNLLQVTGNMILKLTLTAAV
jgi:small subunit ribosomal protein S9